MQRYKILTVLTGINNNLILPYSFNANDEDTWNRLMRNNGDGTFEDVTMESGFTNQYVNTDVTASLGEKMGASWGDYDNDGNLDIFMAAYRRFHLAGR